MSGTYPAVWLVVPLAGGVGRPGGRETALGSELTEEGTILIPTPQAPDGAGRDGAPSTRAGKICEAERLEYTSLARG